MWGAELYWQVSQRSFLVREPVNPVPERACHRRLTPQIGVLPSRTGIEALLQSIDARLAHIQRQIDPKHRLPDKPSSPTNAFPRIIPRREDDQ